MGRRERPRTGYAKRSFWERWRGPLIALAVVATVGLIGALAFGSATAASYTCGRVWDPAATPSPEPSGTGDLGLVQPDMGHNHVTTLPQRYTYCPPASGNHLNARGAGPIEPRLYGPDDQAQPSGWIHNLEHGALVLLYRCKEGDPGCSDATQDQLRDYFGSFPNSPICDIPAGARDGPVFARFDDMSWPFAALVWGRVLPLDTLDTNLVSRFWAQEGERTNPEPQCAPPSASPAASTEPSGSPSASGAPSASVAPSVSPAASPSAS